MTHSLKESKFIKGNARGRLVNWPFRIKGECAFGKEGYKVNFISFVIDFPRTLLKNGCQEMTDYVLVILNGILVRTYFPL